MPAAAGDDALPAARRPATLALAREERREDRGPVIFITEPELVPGPQTLRLLPLLAGETGLALGAGDAGGAAVGLCGRGAAAWDMMAGGTLPDGAPVLLYAAAAAPREEVGAAVADSADLPQDGLVIDLRPGTLPVAEGYALLRPGPVTAAALAALLRREAAAAGLGADVPVVLLSDRASYASDYAAALIRNFETGGRRLAVTLSGIEIEPDRLLLKMSERNEAEDLARAGLIGQACLPLASAIAALADAGEIPAGLAYALYRPAALVWPEGRAFVRWSDPPGDLEALQAAPGDAWQRLFEHLARPIAADLAALDAPLSAVPALYARMRRDEGLSLACDLVLAALPAQRSARLEALLAEDGLRRLVEAGREDEVCRFLAALVPLLGDVTGLGRDALRDLLNMVQSCGLQTAYATALAPMARAICDGHPEGISALFDFLAGTLDGDVLAATLVGTVLTEFTGKRRMRHLNRLINVAVKYCSLPALLLLVEHCDEAVPEFFRSVEEALARIGARLLPHPELRLRLKGSGLTDADLRAAAPPEDLLAHGLATGDRDLVLTTMRRIAHAEEGLQGLGGLLRHQTGALAGLQLTTADWDYSVLATGESLIAFATVLGDVATVRAGLAAIEGAAVEGPETLALAARLTGDAAPMERLYAGWAAAEGLMPLAFPPGDLMALGRGICAQHAEPVTAAGAPLVSVVITTFDADPDLLALSLRSMLNQSWLNTEILLVDDGSQPALRDAVRDAAAMDPRLVFLEAGRNLGPYLCRNLALARARGAFVAIQDADDLSHPQRLERQIAAFADPRVMCTASTHLRIDLAGNIQFQDSGSIIADGTMTSVFRREVFDLLGPFLATRSRGDVEYRERIRRALGPAAFVATQCPLTLCYSAPTTLSKSTERDKFHYLKQLRAGFGRRRWTRRDGRPVPLGPVSVPWQLRP